MRLLRSPQIRLDGTLFPTVPHLDLCRRCQEWGISGRMLEGQMLSPPWLRLSLPQHLMQPNVLHRLASPAAFGGAPRLGVRFCTEMFVPVWVGGAVGRKTASPTPETDVMQRASCSRSLSQPLTAASPSLRQVRQTLSGHQSAAKNTELTWLKSWCCSAASPCFLHTDGKETSQEEGEREKVAF